MKRANRSGWTDRPNYRDREASLSKMGFPRNIKKSDSQKIIYLTFPSLWSKINYEASMAVGLLFSSFLAINHIFPKSLVVLVRFKFV